MLIPVADNRKYSSSLWLNPDCVVGVELVENHPEASFRVFVHLSEGIRLFAQNKVDSMFFDFLNRAEAVALIERLSVGEKDE